MLAAAERESFVLAHVFNPILNDKGWKGGERDRLNEKILLACDLLLLNFRIVWIWLVLRPLPALLIEATIYSAFQFKAARVAQEGEGSWIEYLKVSKSHAQNV